MRYCWVFSRLLAVCAGDKPSTIFFAAAPTCAAMDSNRMDSAIDAPEVRAAISYNKSHSVRRGAPTLFYLLF